MNEESKEERKIGYNGRGPCIFFLVTVITITLVFVFYFMGTLESFTKLTTMPILPVSHITEFNANCSQNKTPLSSKCKQQKTIMQNKESVKYVHYYNKPGFVPGNVFEGCKHKCTLTWKSTGDYQKSDAVMFHGPGIRSKMKPPKKRNSQIWILHSKESASNYPSDFPKWKNVFNWTISYRRDADILAMNGIFNERKNSKTNFNLTRLSSKTKRIAWFVSNCRTPSKRETFVKAFPNSSKIVDIFGGCGRHKCPRRKEKLCMNILKKNYKFYLSFENSLCHDYITEKSFKIYENEVDVIPITRGVGEQYELYLPPNSYINTVKFASIKKLLAFVKKVETNRALWESFHLWKKHYEAHIIDFVEFCELCQRLHYPENYKRLYSNFGTWKKLKGYKRVCKSATDIR